MGANIFVIIFLLSFFHVVVVNGKGGSCQVYKGSLCSPIITTFWLPEGETEESILQSNSTIVSLDPELNRQFIYLNTIGGISSIAEDRLATCFIPLRKLLCLSFYPPCDDGSVTVGPVPAQPCQNLCEEVNELCVILWASETLSTLDCSAERKMPDDSSYPVFPSTNTTLFDGYPVQCVNSLPATTSLDISCLPPYIVLNKKHSSCVPSCDHSLTSLSEKYYRFSEVSFVFHCISFVLTLLICFHLGRSSKRNVYPSSMILYMCIGLSMLQFAFLIMRMQGKHAQKCKPGMEVGELPRASNSVSCFFEYSFLQLGGLLCVFWWLAIGLNMFCTIVLERDYMTRYKSAVFVVCWGMPLLLWIIPLITGHAMWNRSFSSCWLKDKPDTVFVLAYFTVWAFIVLIIQTLCALAAVVKAFSVMYHMMQFDHQASNWKAKIIQGIVPQLRVMALISCFIVVFAVLFTYAQRSIDPDNIAVYEVEFLNAAICASQKLDDCRAKPPAGESLLIATVLIISISGIIFFIIFSLNYYIYQISNLIPADYRPECLRRMGWSTNSKAPHTTVSLKDSAKDKNEVTMKSVSSASDNA